MRRNRYESHYRNTVPVNGVTTFEGSQLTKLSRNKSKVEVSCGHCDLVFEKYACWAKRTKNHFCSRACHNAARVLRFLKNCEVCNAEMWLTSTDMPKYRTCSKECLRKSRTLDQPKKGGHTSSTEYRALAKKLKENAMCTSCGATVGPWSVMGIRTWVENGLIHNDATQARLYCRKCHLAVANEYSKKSQYMTDRFKYYKEKANG